MAKLKLGLLPDNKPVKITVTLSTEQVALIAAYGVAVGSTDGKPPSIERLIPLMAERFIRSDRAFMRLRRLQTPISGGTVTAIAEERKSLSS